MTIRVMVHAKVTDGCQEAFEVAFAQVRANVAGTPGHLGDELLRSDGDPTAYVLLSRWESRERFLEWEDAPVHREMTTPMRPFWSGGIERRIYEVPVN
jgi:heme oxygenase (mycobilin-producing)